MLDRLLAGLGASRPLAEVSGEELAGLLEQLWGRCAPATWNRNRGAVAAWLSWCAASRMPAPVLPASAERRREHLNATRAIPRPAIERALSRRVVPLREKTLWRILYETAARASEVLALTIEDLDLDARRAPIPRRRWAFAQEKCSGNITNRRQHRGSGSSPHEEVLLTSARFSAIPVTGP